MNQMVSNRVCQNCTKKNRKNMKTNKIGHFICGVLATYGLVVACGNMEEISIKENDEEDDKQSCLSKLYSKGDEDL